MSIVLNEHEWAADMIARKTLGKKPSETLSRVARYYIDKGCNKRDTRRFLDLFLLQCDPTSSLPKWSNMLDYAMRRALKYEAIQIDTIRITKPEMARIDALEGTQIRRLAFTLLCLAKYWNIVLPKSDCWVNNKDSEIMALANINTSIKRQCAMYKDLCDCGIIRLSKKVDNTNVRVCFIEEGETALEITDFRNLGYQYLKYRGEPYFECANCGIVTKMRDPKKGRKQKYCDACAFEIKMQQSINAVMRNRTTNHKTSKH